MEDFNFSKPEDQKQFEDLPTKAKEGLIENARQEAKEEYRGRETRAEEERRKMKNEVSFRHLKENASLEIDDLESELKPRLEAELGELRLQIGDGYKEGNRDFYAYDRAVEICKTLDDAEALEQVKSSTIDAVKVGVLFAEMEKDRVLNYVRARVAEFKNSHPRTADSYGKIFRERMSTPLRDWFKVSISVTALKELGMNDEVKKLGLEDGDSREVDRSIESLVEGDCKPFGSYYANESNGKMFNNAGKIAELYMQKGDAENAKEYYEEYLDRIEGEGRGRYYPGDIRNEHLIAAYLQTGDFVGARETYKKEIEEQEQQMQKADDRKKIKLTKAVNHLYEGLLYCDKKIVEMEENPFEKYLERDRFGDLIWSKKHLMETDTE